MVVTVSPTPVHVCLSTVMLVLVLGGLGGGGGGHTSFPDPTTFDWHASAEKKNQTMENSDRGNKVLRACLLVRAIFAILFVCSLTSSTICNTSVLIDALVYVYDYIPPISSQAEIQDSDPKSEHYSSVCSPSSKTWTRVTCMRTRRYAPLVPRILISICIRRIWEISDPRKKLA